MRSRKFIHMGSITSMMKVRWTEARVRERKKARGYAISRQMTVAKMCIRDSTQTIGGRGPYTTVVYLLADVDSDIMYFLIFIMNDELSKTMTPAIDPIVNSVQFHK